MVKFYEWIVDGYYEIGGKIYSPKGTNISDAEEVVGVENLVFTLKDGEYTPYHMATVAINLVNNDLKDLIQEFIPADYPLEFLPVRVESQEYGERIYYVMHFKIIFDVIDRENTVYVPETNSIIKVCLDCKKIEGLHIFNSRPYINDIYISDSLRKAIKKRKLDAGIVFMRVRCV